MAAHLDAEVRQAEGACQPPPVQAQLQLQPVAERAAGQGFNIGSGFLQVWRVDREGGWQIFPYGLQTLAGTPNHTLLSAHAFADEPLPTKQSAHRLTAQGVMVSSCGCLPAGAQ